MKNPIMRIAAMVFFAAATACYPDMTYEDGKLKTNMQPMSFDGGHGCLTSRQLARIHCLYISVICSPDDVGTAFAVCMSGTGARDDFYKNKNDREDSNVANGAALLCTQLQALTARAESCAQEGAVDFFGGTRLCIHSSATEGLIYDNDSGAKITSPTITGPSNLQCRDSGSGDWRGALNNKWYKIDDPNPAPGAPAEVTFIHRPVFSDGVMSGVTPLEIAGYAPGASLYCLGEGEYQKVTVQ